MEEKTYTASTEMTHMCGLLGTTGRRISHYHNISHIFLRGLYKLNTYGIPDPVQFRGAFRLYSGTTSIGCRVNSNINVNFNEAP